MRTVDRELKYKKKNVFHTAGLQKGTLMAPGANNNTGEKESGCQTVDRQREKEGGSEREDGMKAGMTFK